MYKGRFLPTPPHRALAGWSSLPVLLLLVLTGCVGEVLDSRSEGNESARAFDAGAPDRSSSERPLEEERTCPDGSPRPPAAGLRITQVALYQTVKVPLYQDGEWPSDRVAPIIQGKQSLLRVFVETLDDYSSHEVEGVLRVKNGSETAAFYDTHSIRTSSTDQVVDSTFHFEVPGDLVREATQISVALEEPDCEAEGGDRLDARRPRTGTKPLSAIRVGKLRIKLVPMAIEGRLPALDETQRKNIQDAILAYYPIAEAEVTIRVPVSPVINATAPSAVIDEMLARVKEVRFADQPDPDVYYVGIFQPGPSFRAFCENGCVLGLAPQLKQVMPNEQTAVAAFFADARGYETIVHELGHTHGRGHSPCDTGIVPAAIDPNYPDRSGAVGDWGWDFRTDTLIPPTNKDVMTYCNPTWMSAYTYKGLAERSQAVNVQALVRGGVSGASTGWRQLLLRSDGVVRWSGTLEPSPPGTELEPATVRDASGQPVAEIKVARVPFDHTSGMLLYLPDPQPGWHAIDWAGGHLELPRL